MHLPSPRQRVSGAIVTVVLVLLGLVAVAPVRGHAELESATPGPDETVQGSPTELIATFTEPLDAGSTSITVVDAGGSEVAAGGEPGDAPEEWRLDLPELAPGAYEVRWAAQSTIDAHLERGRYAFTVVPAPTPTPAPTSTPAREPSASAQTTPRPTPAATPSPSPSAAPAPPTDPAADSSVLLPIVAVLVLAAGLGAWLFRRRSP